MPTTSKLLEWSPLGISYVQIFGQDVTLRPPFLILSEILPERWAKIKKMLAGKGVCIAWQAMRHILNCNFHSVGSQWIVAVCMRLSVEMCASPLDLCLNRLLVYLYLQIYILIHFKRNKWDALQTWWKNHDPINWLWNAYGNEAKKGEGA